MLIQLIELKTVAGFIIAHKKLEIICKITKFDNVIRYNKGKNVCLNGGFGS